ncbi:MAG: nucleotidyltransferase domain-containing protein [Candidatus Odinarchaeum yellowstonii]|uniref:Nucleotidyltransferase domain-containing protein n=1 Tax=Odinarchaeota yellowstonii (strain LCB_4) TaxID=1841599 RepID=A0AAF0D3K6_ODILC|nr:MAG: nucleotidyltransferase domain-containing protein [Candidatus Odinarchaeum yellowstonii]
MMREKTVKIGDDREVIYTKSHWSSLHALRKKALNIVKSLREYDIESFVHGSLARGDVTSKSDVDIVILQRIPSYKIELILQEKYNVYSKQIIQATPNHSIKGHIHLDESTTITFPLARYSNREYEFYKFGGLITLQELEENKRVPGVNKKLLLIQPTDKGHIEFPILNQEERARKILNVEPSIIRERITVLLKRDRYGRTGIFLNRMLAPHEGFEEVLKQLADENPAVRRRYLDDGI